MSFKDVSPTFSNVFQRRFPPLFQMSLKETFFSSVSPFCPDLLHIPSCPHSHVSTLLLALDNQTVIHTESGNTNRLTQRAWSQVERENAEYNNRLHKYLPWPPPIAILRIQETSECSNYWLLWHMELNIFFLFIFFLSKVSIQKLRSDNMTWNKSVWQSTEFSDIQSRFSIWTCVIRIPRTAKKTKRF